MANQNQSWNGGGVNSSVGEQINDNSLSRFASIESMKKKTFSQMLATMTQPLHKGEKIKKWRQYNILHDTNINDQGIDAEGLTMDKTLWYSWDAAGVRQSHATKVLAQARVGQVRIQSGKGNLYGSSKDFHTQNGAVPLAPEQGGVINMVGTTRTVLEATVKRYSLSIGYTKIALLLDTEASLLARETRELARAFGEMRETQIRNDLITHGIVNATYGGVATQLSEIDETSQLTYADLRRLDKSLVDARCPNNTNMIVGSTNIGTVTIPAARYIYCSYASLPTLEDLTHNAKYLWEDVSSYARGGNIANSDAISAQNFADGEMGRIGPFRFIAVEDMPAYEGAGASATDGVDVGGIAGVEDVGENLYRTDGKYDVGIFLFVGDNAAETYSLSGQTAKVMHKSPTIIPGLDNLGDNGVLSIEWWYGMLVNKPEWIRTHLCSLKMT
jgi:N4-gp56 family major capsid protein